MKTEKEILQKMNELKKFVSENEMLSNPVAIGIYLSALLWVIEKGEQ